MDCKRVGNLSNSTLSCSYTAEEHLLRPLYIVQDPYEILCTYLKATLWNPNVEPQQNQIGL